MSRTILPNIPEHDEDDIKTPVNTPPPGTHIPDTARTERIRLLSSEYTEYPRKPYEEPLCSCGKSASVQRSRTAKSPGKLFWTCSSAKNKCDYFQWIEYAPLTEWYLNYPADAIHSPYKHLRNKTNEVSLTFGDGCVIVRPIANPATYY